MTVNANYNTWMCNNAHSLFYFFKTRWENNAMFVIIASFLRGNSRKIFSLKRNFMFQICLPRRLFAIWRGLWKNLFGHPHGDAIHYTPDRSYFHLHQYCCSDLVPSDTRRGREFKRYPDSEIEKKGKWVFFSDRNFYILCTELGGIFHNMCWEYTISKKM